MPAIVAWRLYDGLTTVGPIPSHRPIYRPSGPCGPTIWNAGCMAIDSLASAKFRCCLPSAAQHLAFCRVSIQSAVSACSPEQAAGVAESQPRSTVLTMVGWGTTHHLSPRSSHHEEDSSSNLWNYRTGIRRPQVISGGSNRDLERQGGTALGSVRRNLYLPRQSSDHPIWCPRTCPRHQLSSGHFNTMR